MTFQMIVTIFLSGTAAFLLGSAGYKFMSAEGTNWEKTKAAFSYSTTIAWNWLNSVSLLLTGGIVWFSEFLGMPGIKETLQPFMKPEYLLAYTVIITLGSMLARHRNGDLGK